MLPPSTLSGGDSHSYMLQMIIKITILVGWFSSRLRRYTRLVQEAANEAAEERRLAREEAALSATKPTTFPQFSRLPAELRQQIWEEALPSSRLLMLQLPGSSGRMPSFAECLSPVLALRKGASSRSRYNSVNVWTCSASIPVALHVNSESRAVALRYYRLGLAPGNTQPRIYVNFKRDIIGLSDELMQSPVGRNLWRLTEDLQGAKRLCLASASAASFMSMRQPYGLGNVTELTLVDSMLWAAGIVPRVAQLDFNHWIAWQCKRGSARWGYGRVVEPCDDNSQVLE
ncbi:hypothetical protein QBC34DRAFT_191117 [Podospora aff. communis PSN243]|uniref:2EXR domain-containing protein n=1 Tax=Podospora aff. communis PSN243 TaxID=3040156 RepID=A0AAV9H112_9PEZI|nr:hypothetical protein QBC34DRAFT_191117 [Podospora aff. communis PSN243]